MTYDYAKGSTYRTEIDLDQLMTLFDQLEQDSKGVRGLKKYIKRWKKALCGTYLSERNQDLQLSSDEIYFFPLRFDETEIKIHFKIDPLNRLKDGIPVEAVPLTEFSEANNGCADILFSYCKTDASFQRRSDPIVIMPLNIAGFNYVVIDGNHRVSNAKDRQEKEIGCVILNAIEAALLIDSEFEKALYLFLFEMSDLERYIRFSAVKYYSRGSFRFPKKLIKTCFIRSTPDP